MSKKVLADTPGQQEVSESSIGNLSKLAGLARQAYEQKRAKDCLDLTRTILLIDPDNEDAQWLRASIQLQIHQDLENARAFLLQARSRDTSEAEAVPTPVLPETQLDSERDGIDSRAEQEPLKLTLASSGTRSTGTPWRWIAGALVVLSLVSGGLLKVLVK